MPAPAHLPDDELLLLAAGAREIPEHVWHCASCEGRLLALQEQMDALAPDAIAPGDAVWMRIADSIRPPSRRVVAGVAASVALAAFTTFGMAMSPMAAAKTLHGTPLAAGARAHVYSPLSGDLLFVATGLPQPGTGRVYELWSIHGRDHVPAAVFRPGQGGQVLLRLTQSLGASAYGVTLEPSPGATHPNRMRVLEETQGAMVP